MSLVVYTDGSCANPGGGGPGGCAWIASDGRWGWSSAEDTTNQRMELEAVLLAMEAIEGDLDIVSDSQYVVRCWSDGWHKSWIRRGWRNSQKQPVANRDLWELVIPHWTSIDRNVRMIWVKGHAGNAMNELADVLAGLARIDPTGAQVRLAAEAAGLLVTA